MFGSFFGKVGGLIGKFFGGGILSTTGRFIGRWLGDALEDSDEDVVYTKIGRTTDNLFPISDAPGKTIPIVFGKARVNGRLIWSTTINEVPVQSSVVKNFKTHSNIYNRTDFLYYCSFAIGICEGKINSVERIWADDQILDLALFKHKIYLGSEDQSPDPLITSLREDTLVPAFKGLAYIVFEDFPLLEFGNKLPVFSFEINNNFNLSQSSKHSFEKKISGVNIIPGSGEFVYDTIVQSKRIFSGVTEIKYEEINCHNKNKIADAVYSLNYLKDICPEVKWVAPVVSWFANSLDIGVCDIFPAVENKTASEVYSTQWRVSGYDRSSARAISRDEYNNPNYGGSVNDESIVRYMQEIKSRGLKIMFYPMIFLDVPGKPWRGHLSGYSKDVHDFFSKERGYNNFVLHYAKLVGKYVDAFIIGSELKNLTSIRDGNHFPAVSELCNLARLVREIVPSSVKISYAADWSEYHHTDGGWYHLDELWSSPYVDFVGIDNYMPLTCALDNSPTENDIINGMQSGEGFEYYLDNTEKRHLAPEYAWKNIKWWWSNVHVNPNGSHTPWAPKSKKIWFTEYGFPSIDKATNQPNVFFDPNCVDGGIPKNSNGNTDFTIQRRAINHFIDYWSGQEYIENMFLWCFDARPYPAWPHSKIWRDYYLWEKGHWINGKIGNLSLASAVLKILQKANIDCSQVDVSMLGEEVCGFCISRNVSAVEIINLLRSIYFFDIRDKAGEGIQFVKRQLLDDQAINYHDLVPNKEGSLTEISEPQESGKIRNLIIKFNDLSQEYKESTESVFQDGSEIKAVKFLSLPFSLTTQEGRNIAAFLIRNSCAKNKEIKLKLPIIYFGIRPADLLKLQLNMLYFVVRVESIEITRWEIYVSGIIEETEELYTKFLPHKHMEDSHKINGYVRQILIPSLSESEEDTKNQYIYFVNFFACKKPLYVGSREEGFLKITDIDGGSTAANVLYANYLENENYLLVDEKSFIDVKIVYNRPRENIRSLWNASSMMIFDRKIFYAGKITKIANDIYRLTNLIFIQDTTSSRRRPGVGAEIIFLDKIQKLEFSSDISQTLLFYKSYLGEEAIVI